MDENLARSIIEIAIFLEYCSEDLLDPDAAIEATEQLAAPLQKTSDDTKKELISAFQELAPEYNERANFVLDLVGNFGIE
ncbi:MULTISPECIES: hypothetical protein [unclassified Variovorax]|uniref:hypothetical protein n=1 Tax=unclassified Variovorax TaxID=663243 RepID=UPI001C431A26|nr:MULTISPECIES: hypothetical protein [unclassified Variovorax]